MAEHVRVAVIGGGAVGCSALYHLAALGWTDALLLEQDELTSGSTWHAAGNCPTFSTSWGILKLQAYSALLYQRLADIADYPIAYHVTGSVRLSHTRDRLREFFHVAGMARANGIDYAVLTPAELREKYPLAELHDLYGALWDPLDGDIDPAQMTQAFAAVARKLGARVRRFTKVTALAQLPGGAWSIAARDMKTGETGRITADVVVNAAGYRAGEVMALLGQHLPTVCMSHQYLVTEDIPELASRKARLPLLRDPDSSYYLRQERQGFVLGPYEWQATPMWLDGIPEDFSYKLWDDDLGRLDRQIEDACARVPLLRTAGVRRVVNGPIRTRRTATRISARRTACAISFIATPSVSASARPVVQEKRWRSGSWKAGRSGICGRSIQDGSPATRRKALPRRKRSRFTRTSMRRRSRTRSARPDGRCALLPFTKD